MNVKVAAFAVSLFLIVLTWLYLTHIWRQPSEDGQNTGMGSGNPHWPLSPGQEPTFLPVRL